MIFNPELAAKVLDGSKTETRRPVKPGETRCRYRPGRTYAVQDKRGGKSLGRIHVVFVLAERLAAISNEDAWREGFDNRLAFLAYWRKLYGAAADLEVPVWVIRFELADERHLRAEHAEALGLLP